MTRVAFQGVYGAYSQQATEQYFGQEADAVPCERFEDIFRLVESEECDFGMLPVENSTAGSVNQAFELLMDNDLRIYAEVILRVHHMLLAPPGTEMKSIRIVRSHPQALVQCQRFLARRGLACEPTVDTAAAAEALSAAPAAGVAVIAGEGAAARTGLEILEARIEDAPSNYTRFFVLSTEDSPSAQRNKTSLVFTTPHQSGALYGCLGEFATRRVSLCKIESRPRRRRPWQYLFYLDFEGHHRDPRCEAAIMGLLRRSTFVKILGSYPAATTPVDVSEATADGSSLQEGST